ncbi:serine/threonine protein kinase, partial [Podospora didyma]
MISYVYPSAFGAGAEPVPVTSESNPAATPTQASNTSSGDGRAGLASLFCHVKYLENKLRRYDGQQSTFANPQYGGRILDRTRIAAGLSFIVERAVIEGPPVLSEGGSSSAVSGKTPTRTVVIKTVREDQNRQGRWHDVLLEIRALLHNPIHYHPNIVRLLDIRWDASIDTGSSFPILIQEYGAFGTLDKLQKSDPPLPFSIKQKICYDVGRGLSIIHACGIVHGDLKHENVLIFANRYSEPQNQPYTAKLADFGGTVMDLSGRYASPTHRLRMHTFPYDAPEINDNLSPDGAKKTDVFSYGMLVWRCMIDSRDIPSEIGFKTIGWVEGGTPTEEQRKKMRLLKISDGLLDAAIHNLSCYFHSNEIPGGSFSVTTSAIIHTLRGDPTQRSFDRALARMRGMESVTGYLYTTIKNKANARILEDEHKVVPGQRGMTVDKVGFVLGSLGDDYDAQINLPGFRPNLSHPPAKEFHFEPLKLKRLMDWSQQEQMIREFKAAADFTSEGSGDEPGISLPPRRAAHFLFQSYLCGFGAAVSSEMACHWLHRATSMSRAAGHQSLSMTDMYSQAWDYRFHRAFGIQNSDSEETQFDHLHFGVERGFRFCYDEAQTLIASSTAGDAQISEWKRWINVARINYRLVTSSTGMLLFRQPQLRGNWDIHHMKDRDLLDKEIMEVLGAEYGSCIRENADEASLAGKDPGVSGEARLLFDRIYVNNWGHGLLHMAASFGRLELGVLKYLHEKYICDIDLKSQKNGDTPLICACRSAWLDCVIYLLEKGADPSGDEESDEPPLHCIASFSSELEINEAVTRLLDAGADLEKPTSSLTDYWADWEDDLKIPVTPLGRAVIKQSLVAVRVLLRHGADPSRESSSGRSVRSPIELAAILTLPDILEELLSALDTKTPEATVLDELDMLEAARTNKITKYDSLSLHSRVVRCGVRYKDWLSRTMLILRARSRRVLDVTGKAPQKPAGRHMCKEISFGNTEIVEILLGMGYSVEGSPRYRPIQAAVYENNKKLFDLLVKFDSPLSFPEDTHSLLHILADRPKCTPPHASEIAEYLIDTAGLPVDPVGKDIPSPLSKAVACGRYDLASLLISKGAGKSVNCIHPLRPSSDSYSLLGVLSHSHTSGALRGMKFLAQLHNDKSNSIRVSPLSVQVSSVKGLEMSVIHTLACTPITKWNSHGQISASILQCGLDMFPDPASLGDLYVNPKATTPLGIAVMCANTEVFNSLMASSY